MQELDWCALQGINLPLAPCGIEAVWLDTFTQDFGLSAQQLEGFFPGPAFLAWGRCAAAAPPGGNPGAAAHAATQPPPPPWG